MDATTHTRTNPLSYLSDQLNELKDKGTYFRLRVLEDEQAPECTLVDEADAGHSAKSVSGAGEVQG